jgi:RNA polymerase sigma factor (sigma-70 family)
MKDLSPYRGGRYKNQSDFVNKDPIEKQGTVFPAGLEEYIEKYKKTRDPQYSFRMMVVLSDLIFRMLHQEVKRYNILRGIEMQELYNASFICLHKAALKFDVSKSSLYSFPRYLQGYIKEEVKRVVRGKAELVCCGIAAAEFIPEEQHCTAKAKRAKLLMGLRLELKNAMQEMIETGEVQREVMEMFVMRHEEGYGYKEIAEKIGGKTPKAVKHRISRVLDKLKHKFRYCRKTD